MPVRCPTLNNDGIYLLGAGYQLNYNEMESLLGAHSKHFSITEF